MTKFTEEQKLAIKTIDGNVCAIASAGSGKTSAFVTRIALMIKKGIEPSDILAITFTKKASEEMKKRLKKMVGKDESEKVSMGTTHSIFYRLLKRNIKGFDKLLIMPEWNRYQILKDITQPYDEAKNPHGLNIGCSVGDLSSFISYQKSNAIKTFEGIILDENTYEMNMNSYPKELLIEAFKTYENAKNQGRQIDFDDIMLKMFVYLNSNKEFRKEIQSQFKYIMVDEFQDSSKIVMEIVRLINDKNVFVVGDFRQSIYSFINARVENILNFHKDFDNVTIIELNKNFRSTNQIVEFSNQIINNSTIESFKDYKMSESHNGDGELVELKAYADEHLQAIDIVRKIESLINDGVSPSEISVLFRTNSESVYYEDELSRLDIPYIVSKSTSFYDRNEIVDILSYMSLAINPNNDSAIRRIYNKPNRYLSKKMFSDIEKYAKDNDTSLFNAFQNHPLRNTSWSFKKNADALVNVIRTLGKHKGLTAFEVCSKVLSLTQYVTLEIMNKDNNSNAVDKEGNVMKLLENTRKFPSVESLLVHISRMKDKQKKAPKNQKSVTLSTIHSSKGLEWDYVYVTSVSNGVIPHEQNFFNTEEERRLFYVACSRPRLKLHVSWYSMKLTEDKNGQSKTINLKPSVFVQELISSERAFGMSRDAYSNGDSIFYNINMNNLEGIDKELGYELDV